VLWGGSIVNIDPDRAPQEEAMLFAPLSPRIRRPLLESLRASDLMTPNPVSVRHDLSVRQAGLFLHDRGIGAAPVVNDAGRAVGVLSRSDVLLALSAGVDTAPVREVMTPSVVVVPRDATALDLTNAMVRHMVRRVFVTDGEGVPVGVVSATDLFRGLSSLWVGTADRSEAGEPPTGYAARQARLGCPSTGTACGLDVVANGSAAKGGNV